MIAQPGTPAEGYTLDVKYDPENDDAFEAKATFNDGTVKNLGAGGSGGSSVFYIDYTETQGIPQVTTLQKTWNEIMAAVSAGMVPIIKHEYEDSVLFSPVSYVAGGDSYRVDIGDYPNTKTLTCSDPDDYPTRTYYPE